MCNYVNASTAVKTLFAISSKTSTAFNGLFTVSAEHFRYSLDLTLEAIVLFRNFGFKASSMRVWERGSGPVCVRQIDNIVHKTKRRAAKFMNRLESCLPHKSCLLPLSVGLLVPIFHSSVLNTILYLMKKGSRCVHNLISILTIHAVAINVSNGNVLK